MFLGVSSLCYYRWSYIILKQNVLSLTPESLSFFRGSHIYFANNPECLVGGEHFTTRCAVIWLHIMTKGFLVYENSPNHSLYTSLGYDYILILCSLQKLFGSGMKF
ncbi:hypothetical protein HanRHA438_Chr01g0017041 [Helianthus annuus]|nr:hypothetical protein HanRHA438_Chr01g0017041 [Helianthus annuus]